MPTPSLVQSKSGTATTGTSLTITLTSPTTAGNCLIVCPGANQGTTNPTVSGITLGGSAGNFASAKSLNNNAETDAEIWADPNCAGGQTSVVITFSAGSGSNAGCNAWVMEWSGIATASPADKTNGASGSGNFSSGSSGTLTQASELVIGTVSALLASGSITGPSSPWTNLAQLTLNATSGAYMLASYQVVSATTAQTYSGTLAGGSLYTAVVATFKASSSTTHPGTASLTGTGTLTAAWAYEGTATLSGSGTMTAAGMAEGGGAATLSGSGTLTSAGKLTYEPAATLTGSGTLAGASVGFGSATLTGSGTLSALQSAEYGAALTGTGTASVSGEHLGFSAVLTGTGTLGVARVLGIVTAGASRGVTTIPYAWPGSSQVAVAAPGSSTWYYLGTLGQVTALTYSFKCPGGCDQLTCTVMVPASYRTNLFNPGWQVRVTRGGHTCWTGVLDEPVPTTSGWNLSAVGTGNLGTNYLAVYTDTWPTNQPDESVNGAISRGLPWVNPGVGSPAGIWAGQAVDSGGQTITALLNLMCSRGGLIWSVNSQPGGLIGNSLSVFDLPSAPNRLLICTTPVARTLATVNVLYIRYEITADSTDSSGNATPATYGLVQVANSVSADTYGDYEQYLDVSDAGPMTAAEAEQIGAYILEVYQQISFSGSFTAHYGELLNLGGAAIDPGTDQAGSVMKLILTDFAYGGSVIPQPVSFLVGSYSWDDFTQVATIQAYQTLNQSISSLLSLEGQLLTPIQAASGG